ncbi:MAG TPA: hypothetical protein VHW93_03635 [Acidimicrobiales bacterium]|nr:hypothetical protein [Acidimicrobiales bacterium]
MSLAFTFCAYAIGALTGLAVHRGGPRLQKGWPVYLRAQLVATAALLGLFSAWRLTAPHQIVAPIVLAGVGGVLLMAPQLIRGPRSTGLAELEGWAAFPNSTFWVLPIAGALVGPAASAITALTNAVYAAPNAVCIHLMRRDAPIPQRHSTSWLDQSMLVAVGLGLALHLAGPAPAASHWVLVVAGPLLAFVGAALYTGSVFHPHNASVTTSAADGWRWLVLTGIRVAYLGTLAIVTGSAAVAVIAVLSAFGPPAFNPPQQAVLYGYRSGLVMVAVRWGWVFLPVGLVIALLVR